MACGRAADVLNALPPRPLRDLPPDDSSPGDLQRTWSRLRRPILAIALAVSACGPQTPPTGAQLLHVTVDGLSIRVEPVQGLRAGTIYLVLETLGSSVTFVQARRFADGPIEPLSEADLARLAKGDTYQTISEAFNAPCVGQAGEAGRGQIAHSGGCGNVFPVEISRPGTYAFRGAMTGSGSVPMAVFQVQP